MRRLFTLFLTIASAAGIVATAYDGPAATTAQPRKVLLEEFTGVFCGNCPAGHKIAQQLQTSLEGDFYSVCIHAGSFSQSNEYNFIVPEGKAINEYFGIEAAGYPSGIVNRASWNNLKTVLSRSSWTTAARAAMATISPVNLALSATYDPATRLITAQVDGYAVEECPTLSISVMLLQSDVLGIQSGGLLGDEYPHRHMLRATLHDNVMGDAIGKLEAGGSFTKTYTYTLPEKIGTVATVVRDLQLLAFAAESDVNIYTVAEAYPTVAGAAEETYASFAAPLLPIGTTYGFDFFEVLLQNKGTAALTSADFSVTINNTTRSLRWEGNIPAHTSATVAIALGDLTRDILEEDEENEYSIEMTAVNGIAYTTGPDYVLKGKFIAPKTIDSKLQFKVRTDNYASDNRFLLRDAQGNVVHEFGPYPAGEQTTDEVAIELQPGATYCVEVTDAWGDGVYSPRGYVQWRDSNDELAGQISEISGYGQRAFFRTVAASAAIEAVGCDADAADQPAYDLLGRPVKDTTAPGIYISQGRKIIVTR